MTVDEINLIIENENYKIKHRMQTNYENARLTASFVSTALGGKEIPELWEVYPNMFEEEREMAERKQIEAMQAKFLTLQIANNSQRKGR